MELMNTVTGGERSRDSIASNPATVTLTFTVFSVGTIVIGPTKFRSDRCRRYATNSVALFA